MACSKYSDGKLLEINDYNNPMITKIEMKLKECKIAHTTCIARP